MTKSEYINRVLLIMNEAGLFDKEGNSFIGADTAQVDRFIEGSYVDAWRRCAGVMPKAWFKNASFRTAIHKPNLTDGTGFVVLPDDFYLLTYFKMQGWKKPIMDAYLLNERTSAIQSNPYTRGSQIRPAAVIEPVAAIDFIESLVDEQINYWQDIEPPQPQGGALPDGEKWYDNVTKSMYIMDAGQWVEYLPTIGHLYEDLSGNAPSKYAYIKTYDPDAETVVIEFENYDPYSDIKQSLTYYSLKKGLASHTIEEAIYVPAAQPLTAIDNDDELELDHRILEPMAYLSASSVFTIFEKYDIAKALEQKVVEMFPALRSVKGTNITFKQ